jgi:hypothetical protein
MIRDKSRRNGASSCRTPENHGQRWRKVCGIGLAVLSIEFRIRVNREGVSKMEWGILITMVMLVGMMGLAMFEATNVDESRAKPDAKEDADEPEVKKAA